MLRLRAAVVAVCACSALAAASSESAHAVRLCKIAADPCPGARVFVGTMSSALKPASSLTITTSGGSVNPTITCTSSATTWATSSGGRCHGPRLLHPQRVFDVVVHQHIAHGLQRHAGGVEPAEERSVAVECGLRRKLLRRSSHDLIHMSRLWRQRPVLLRRQRIGWRGRPPGGTRHAPSPTSRSAASPGASALQRCGCTRRTTSPRRRPCT